MTKTETLRHANKVLAELDAVFANTSKSGQPLGDGLHQKFLWFWSPDLVVKVPCFNDDGGFVFDYVCQCGIDRRVHAPGCSGFTRAKVKMTTISALGARAEDPQYARCWILARWKAPMPFDAWVELMHTEEDYPANGSYIPVSHGANYVHFPADQVPTEDVSRVVVQMFRRHAAEWRAEYRADLDKANRREVPFFDAKGNVIEDAATGSEYHKIRDRLKSRMTLNGHVPGKKDSTLIFTESMDSVRSKESPDGHTSEN
jgi:hypothetical protein